MARREDDPHPITADLVPPLRVTGAYRVGRGVPCGRRRFLLLLGTLPLIRVPLLQRSVPWGLADTRAMFARKVSG
jgi:hypothetical protein